MDWRKSKLSNRTKRQIKSLAVNKKQSCREIQRYLGLNVHHTTVFRTLKSNPTVEYSKLKTGPKLLSRHKALRQQFSRNYIRSDFSKWIFSDEKKFNLDGPDGINFFWRDIRKEKEVFSRRNFGGGSLMVHGAFSGDSCLPLAFPSSKMDSKEYQTVLDTTILPYLQCETRRNMLFQRDNAPFHVSKSTVEWFKNKSITTVNWPPNSPDLNPMENVWGMLVRRVYSGNKVYERKAELKKSILKEWNEITLETRKSLVDSLPNRLLTVIEKKGNFIPY